MENVFGVLLAIGFVIISVVQNYKKEAQKAAKRVPHRRPSTPSTINIPQPPSPARKREIMEKKVERPQLDYKPDLPIEVIAAQEKRKERQRIKKLEVAETEEHATMKKPFEFNLREAIIQSAILERPYK